MLKTAKNIKLHKGACNSSKGEHNSINRESNYREGHTTIEKTRGWLLTRNSKSIYTRTPKIQKQWINSSERTRKIKMIAFLDQSRLIFKFIS